MNTYMLIRCYMITWMNNTNSFRLSKVQHQGVAEHLLDFFVNFSQALLINVLLIRKKKKRLMKRIAEKVPSC